MLDGRFPNDLLGLLVHEYLSNDHVAICRLKCCSVYLRDTVETALRRDPLIWKRMADTRWSRGDICNFDPTNRLFASNPWAEAVANIHTGSLTSNEDVYEAEFSRFKFRVGEDHRAERNVWSITNGLVEWFGSSGKSASPKASDDNDERERILQPGWHEILASNSLVYDRLQSLAIRHSDALSSARDSSLQQRCLGYVLQKLLRSVVLYEGAVECDRILNNTTESSAKLIEQCALLVLRPQMSVQQLLQEDGYYGSTTEQRVMSQLDEVADRCREQLPVNGSALERIQHVNCVLFEDMKFAGNTGRYYDARNSLLSYALETRKAIPLTLAILFLAVCRRLGIHIDVIGLPGHVIVGFSPNTRSNNTNDDDADDDNTVGADRGSSNENVGTRQYIDVFHGGKLLETAECERIVASYQIPWRENFLDPISPPAALHRILNNLSNCHQMAGNYHAAMADTFLNNLTMDPNLRQEVMGYVKEGRGLQFYETAEMSRLGLVAGNT